MQPITPYRFHAEPPTCEPLSAQQAETGRTHPNRPLKQRIEFELDSEQITANMQHRVYRYPAHMSRDETVRQRLIKELRSTLLKQEHLYVVQDQDLIKACGYAGYPLSTRGTSVPGRLCFTESLMNCVGVGMSAVAGENADAVNATKIRISHVFGFSEDEFAALRDQIEKMQQSGKVKIVLLGGTADNRDEVASLKNFLANLDVQIELDEAGELRPLVGSFLGMAIDELDRSPHYVKGMVTVAFSDDGIAVGSHG